MRPGVDSRCDGADVNLRPVEILIIGLPVIAVLVVLVIVGLARRRR